MFLGGSEEAVEILASGGRVNEVGCLFADKAVGAAEIAGVSQVKPDLEGVGRVDSESGRIMGRVKEVVLEKSVFGVVGEEVRKMGKERPLLRGKKGEG